VLDVIRERRPPFSPEGVVEEFCAVLRQYSIYLVRGDKYAGQWPAEQFGKRGVTYEPCERTKSELYQDLLPLINSKQAALLDLPILQRRKDSIDHAPGAKDDVANVVAGALLAEGTGDPRFHRRLEYSTSGLV
jgi:hypothetical protein